MHQTCITKFEWCKQRTGHPRSESSWNPPPVEETQMLGMIYAPHMMVKIIKKTPIRDPATKTRGLPTDQACGNNSMPATATMIPPTTHSRDSIQS
mmetsp:Transcript_68195/g.134709  ORF Transcript_68195/g.134709 Transcript_68195/m.134709 type:complete len:95 (-) Transcript_68195:1058-1342(-)